MKEKILVSHPKSRMYYPKSVEVVDGFIQLVKGCGDTFPSSFTHEEKYYIRR